MGAMLVGCPHMAPAFYPSQSKHEFRLVAKSNYGVLRDWTIEGSMFESRQADKLKVTTGFRFSKHNSAIGANIVYSVNDLVNLAVHVDLDQKIDFGGGFWVYGDYKAASFTLKPYLKVSHNKVGELGAVLYTKIAKADVHVGAGLIVPAGLENFSIRNSSAVLIVGTSFNYDPTVLKNLLGGK